MTKDIQDLMLVVERARDRFHAAVFVDADPDATVALADPGCVLTHLPTDVGAAAGDLHRHVAEDVAGHRPADLAFRRVSRTGDRWQVVDESLVSFTHDRDLRWLLPGVEPTGRAVEVRSVSIVAVRRSLVTEYRTLWDHASLLSQLGLGADPRSGISTGSGA